MYKAEYFPLPRVRRGGQKSKGLDFRVVEENQRVEKKKTKNKILKEFTLLAVPKDSNHSI